MVKHNCNGKLVTRINPKQQILRLKAERTRKLQVGTTYAKREKISIIVKSDYTTAMA